MSEAQRKFPLPLSSVMGKSQKKPLSDADYRLKEIASRTTTSYSLPDRFSRNTEKNPTTNFPRTIPVSNKKSGFMPIRAAVAMAEKIAAQGVRDTMVLSALCHIPRHLFVATGFSEQAYVDTALPIGHQQTISRPYVVAKMIEAVRVDVGDKKLAKVLEIGTGCGYQAAVLSQVADEVYSIERIRALHELAKNNLRQLRIPNLRLQYGDGMLGLPQAAPFDAIIIAAAGLKVPETLFTQLTIGGYLIAPVGNERQSLQLTKRTGERQWQSVILEECHFVPLCQGVI